ncbi:MAG: magnesium transporter [Thermogutta sp.]|nr:magnesium transporter [Thermogutta sp.]HOP76771.1 magnesium transporter [Thermogutta sp.]HPU05385.1 magnesium transporter [Thermogutta sp.]HQF14867.1 magnesium transporter [Thermogutta sp.]
MSNEAHTIAKRIIEALDRRDHEELVRLLQKVPEGELPQRLAQLTEADQRRLLEAIPAEVASSLLQELPESQVTRLLEELAPSQAAAILDHLPSDEQADLLGALPDEEASKLLEIMNPEEASDARRLLQFAPDTAGGLMITEYLAYTETCTVEDIVEDLRINAARYRSYDVQYFYTVDAEGRLTGVLRVRDLLLSEPDTQIATIAVRQPVSVATDTSLDKLEHLFAHYQFYGLPVVDRDGRLVGLVRRYDVEEAIAARANRNFLKVVGISGGEELRSMPLRDRIKGRTSWLTVNLILDLIAASVIPFFEETISAVIALVFFLPIISDMGGNTGIQSIGVTLRELAAGLITPRDAWRTFWRELPVAVINGLVVGFLLAGVALVWRGNPYLGILIGSALTLNTVIAACLGAVLPLGLRRIGIDPAVASGPILTTIADLTGFFMVLGGAAVILPYLT